MKKRHIADSLSTTLCGLSRGKQKFIIAFHRNYDHFDFCKKCLKIQKKLKENYSNEKNAG
jgi:hypothetical protein